jgi:hypothetical protein
MRHNLTAVFNNRIDAQQVLDELLVPGYPCSGTTLVSPPAADATHAVGSGPYGMLKRRLVRLFESAQHEPPQADHPAFRAGRHVISTSVATDPDSVRAIALIERFSPVYIEDRRKPAESAL